MKQLFCDLDGTLLDVSTRHYKVYCELMEKYHGNALPFAEYWDLKRKKTRWPDLLPMSGVPAAKLDPFLQDFIPKIEDPAYLKLDKPFPGSLEALQALANTYDCNLVSLRRNEQNLLAELGWLGIRKYFQHILSGHSENDGYDVKIELIRQHLGPEGGVIVGDTEADIVTGKELGLTTVAVLSGIRDESFLRALEPDYLIPSIAEIGSVL